MVGGTGFPARGTRLLSSTSSLTTSRRTEIPARSLKPAWPATMWRMKRLIPLLLVVAVAGCGGGSHSTSAPQARNRAATVSIQTITRTPTPPPTPRPPQLCLVTQDRGISPSYVPPDLVTLPKEWSVQTVQLRRDAAQALIQLLTAARADGEYMQALSGYRSYDEQVEVLQQEIKDYGEAQARKQVAPPGHSEHQLGVAVDVVSAKAPYDLEDQFGETPEGQWLAANAPRFGFVISYPKEKEAITGYIYEPWHIRYVGLPLAEQIAASGQTLTEYLPAHGMAGCPPDV